ncbi:MAG: polysaccharide deacetylase family protein [Pseudomonadota bacterium]
MSEAPDPRSIRETPEHAGRGLTRMVARGVGAVAAALALGVALGIGFAIGVRAIDADLTASLIWRESPPAQRENAQPTVPPAASASAAPPDCPPHLHVGGREIIMPAIARDSGALRADMLGLQSGEYVLTFDDGPTWITEEILDTLDRHCAPATFFMIGKRAEERPLTAKRVLRDGHSLGNHTYSHVNLTTLDQAAAAEEIRRGAQAIQSATAAAHAPALMRAPAFRMNEAAEAAARSLATVLIGPDISPQDWRGDAPEATLVRLKAALAAKDRGVILLHDNQPNTREMLRQMLTLFAATGRKIVALRERPAHGSKEESGGDDAS